MTQRAALVVLLTVLLSVATGCGGDRGKPLDFAPAPWRDGESAIYDVYDKTRKRRGSKTFTWRREGNATWRLEQNDDSGRSRVHLVDDSLAPLESREERDGETVVVHFGSDTISIERGGDTKQVERPYDAIDGDQFYQLFRALPFAEGYERQLSFVDTTTGESPRMTVSVEAAEQVRVPAGDIRAWRVVVDTGAGGVRELLYGAEPPHPFVRYRWPMVSESVLRSYVPEEGAARVGPEAPVDEPAGEPDKPLPINWPLVILQVCVSLPLMMLFPVILGWRLLRRLRVSFRIWALGAGCYVVSQVVHLPLNWLLGLSGSSGPLSGAPLWVVGLSVGLSAALCEELARYAFMRGWLAKRGELGWHRGVVFGAGHGGIEAMILGAMVGMGVVNLVAATFMADAQTRELIRPVAEHAMRSPWWEAVYAGVERVGAISAHIAMSVLVMRSVTRRRVGWLLAAIALHAAIDAPIVYKGVIGIHGMQGLIILVGLLGLGITIALREPATEVTSADEPSAEEQPPTPPS